MVVGVIFFFLEIGVEWWRGGEILERYVEEWCNCWEFVLLNFTRFLNGSKVMTEVCVELFFEIIIGMVPYSRR